MKELILNQKGLELLKLKEENNIDVNNPFILGIKLVAKDNFYYSELIEKLTSKKVSKEEFSDFLKTNRDFVYSEGELRKMNEKNVIDMYDNVLSPHLKYYTLNYNMNTNILKVTRLVGIGTKYYSNFLGVDIPTIPSSKTDKKYRYSYYNNQEKEIKEIEEKYKKFQNFAKLRLNAVGNNIIKSIEMPTLLKYKKSILSLDSKIEKSQVLKSHINLELTLSINLDKDTNKFVTRNSDIIIKIFTDIDTLVDKYMNYELYK